jgi:membrane protease YdiL (CAAX protease family)
MLFLLKRYWQGGVAGLALLASLGLALRALFASGPAFEFTFRSVALGIAIFGVVLTSDVILHGLLLLLFGERYRQRHRELAAVFRWQTFPAMLAGAAMAGVGEELVFRGLSLDLAYLSLAAIAFGALHHLRRRLWPFTLWSIYQGLLLAGALYLTEALAVTMVAHFLHDLTGFFIFRHLNGLRATQQEAS